MINPRKLGVEDNPLIWQMFQYKPITNNHTQWCNIKVVPFKDFAGGLVVRNPPVGGGDMGSVPAPGRSLMLRDDKLGATATEAHIP